MWGSVSVVCGERVWEVEADALEAAVLFAAGEQYAQLSISILRGGCCEAG